MKLHVIIVSISFALLFSCGNSNKVTKTNYTNFYSVADTTIVASQTKGYCFGKCPVYKLNIRANGKVELNAIDHLNLENGDYTATISQAEIEDIYAYANEIHFFELENIYDDEYIQDVSATYVSLMNKETQELKSIKDRWKAPVELKKFEEVLHKLVEELEWVPVTSN